jgi:alginate O-acetyltransferase complex protein AlgI
MLFSSPAFLFGFLPVFFLAYFASPAQFRNGIILIGSLLFYFIDGGYLISVLCGSIIFNFYAALYLARASGLYKKIALLISITVNLIPLLFYKYWMFFLQSANDFSLVLHSNVHFEVPEILLLAGVSFFTFHAISYLLDVSSKKVDAETSLTNFGMYMVNFPQLIAGPIVRYSEISSVIRTRPIFRDQIYLGIFTFAIGLAMKVVLADSAGNIADTIFALPKSELTTGLAWLGAFAYSMQIYFDFAGYSNMAIGLGRIMGFEFPENFNQPYRSKNITEFWRRWHMTLSRWFRDYVYIPLGGNQKGQSRTLTNLLIIFFLCGLWHGASYTFIVWGLYHGILLVVERGLSSGYGYRTSGWAGQILTFILVMFGWVIFRSVDLTQAVSYISVMFGFADKPTSLESIKVLLTLDKKVYLTIAVICSIYPMERITKWSDRANITILQGIVSVVILAFCAALIAANGFNPFIYFRF